MSEFELEYYEMKEKYENLEQEFISYKNTSEEFELELENQNKILSVQIDTLNREITNLKTDLKKLKEKNLEKLKEIELYERDIEKQKTQTDKLSEEKTRLEKRIVLLENDNSDFMNKIRELECWSDELRRKLDTALEENIVQNNVLEMYKLEMEENLQRYKEDLEDAKNEINSKDIIIERMTKESDLILKNASKDDPNNLNQYTKLNREKFIKSCKSYKNVNKMRNSSADIMIPGRFSFFESKIKIPSVSESEKISKKDFQSFSKSCLEMEIIEQDVDKEIEIEIENILERQRTSNKSKDNLLEKEMAPIDNNHTLNDKQKDKLELCNEAVKDKEINNTNSIGSTDNEHKNLLHLTQDVNSHYNSINVTPNQKIINQDPQVDVEEIIKSNEEYILNSIAMKTKNSYIYTNSHTPGNIPTPLNLNTPTKDKDKVDTSHFNFNYRSNLTCNENAEDEREFIRNKIEMEIQNILDNRKVFMQQALIQENFSFDFLSNKINNNVISPYQNIKNMNKEKLLKNIDDMLNKIQERKEKITAQKNVIETKMDKVRLKIF